MIDKINQQMSVVDIGMLVTLSVLWGGSFFFVEVLINHLPPLTIVTCRVGFASIGLWAIVIALKTPLPKKLKHWTGLVVVGVLNNALPFCLIAWGQTQIGSGLASIFNATTPFFTVLVASAFLADERLTPQKFAGVLLGLVGTIVLIGPGLMSGLLGSVLGQAAVLGAALSYAFAAVYSRRFKSWGLSPLIVATGQTSIATGILLPIALTIDGAAVLAGIPQVAVASIIGLAFFSTVLAYILYFRLIETAGATNAALVTFLVPISAVILGVMVLGELFSQLQAFGMSLIAVGLITIDGRVFRGWRFRRST